MKRWQNPVNTVSQPSMLADVIYTDVIYGTEQLRYRATEDVNFLLYKRKIMSDEQSIGMMNSRLEKQ